MGRSQFTFYRSFWEAVKELPPKGRTEVICAICEYVFEESHPQLSGVSKAVFSLIKPTLDTAARKATNGKLGGSKTKANGKQNENEKEKEEEEEKEVEKEKEREIEKESYISPPLPPPAEKPKTGNVRFEALKGDDGFESFWAAYPKKSGDIREACRLYLEAIDAGATLQQMLDAIAWQKDQDSWLDQGGRYIPSPAKWLANKAWLQMPIKPKPQEKAGRKDVPNMDYGSPNRADYEAMQRLIDKMGTGTEETAKAVQGESGWSCGKCGADLGATKGLYGRCPDCGMKLIYGEGGKT